MNKTTTAIRRSMVHNNMPTTTTAQKLVASLAARIARHWQRGWLGSYYFSSSRDAYRAVARSVRLARAGLLHGGHGPYGRGPAAWLS